jgi:hypothetical protein
MLAMACTHPSNVIIRALPYIKMKLLAGIVRFFLLAVLALNCSHLIGCFDIHSHLFFLSRL